MINRFVDDAIALSNVRYQDGNIVFNTYICDDEYSVFIIERIKLI